MVTKPSKPSDFTTEDVWRAVEDATLYCLFCVDKAIESDDYEPRKAMTLVPFAQVLTVAGQNIVGVTAVPCCQNCRAEQIGRPSSNGRLIVT